MALITLGANSGKGKVLQVVQTVFSTSFSTTSSSTTDTGLNASITPTSTNNNILIILSSMLRARSASNTTTFAWQKLWRGAVETGTQLHNGYPIIGSTDASDVRGVGNVTYLDNPSTTSSVTYRVSLEADFASEYVGMNNTTAPSTLTLMEIQG